MNSVAKEKLLEMETQPDLVEYCLDFGNIIDEIEFSPMEVDIEKLSDTVFCCVSLIDDVWYRVLFREPPGLRGKVYEIVLRRDSQRISAASDVADILAHINDFQNGLESTNANVPIKVFSFVISAVQTFIRIHSEVAVLHFSPTDSKRTRIYENIAKKIAPIIQWEVKPAITSMGTRIFLLRDNWREKIS